MQSVIELSRDFTMHVRLPDAGGVNLPLFSEPALPVGEYLLKVIIVL
jgi:hypothetical protein